MLPNVGHNLQSGFRKAGIFPLDPEQVLKCIPDDTGTHQRDPAKIGRDLDESLIELLKENRGHKQQPKRKHGKKIQPGAQITLEALSATPDAGASTTGVQSTTIHTSDSRLWLKPRY